MLHKNLFISILLLTFFSNGFAQVVCGTLGQNPGTAFPVCGTDTFRMDSVPVCGDKVIPAPCTSSSVVLTDKNPFWYRFTSFTAGTLGFLIKPNISNDDYDWQLFDITNRTPDEVYTDGSLFVACNWSGEVGNTGASATGNSLVVCASETGAPFRPLFSAMPVLKLGHTYLLLISHFSDSQSGYSLSFGGGTASITDPINPALLKARAPCDGTKISIKLNKKMKCSSLAANGSDFTISPAIAPIISASGIGCNTGFDMDSVVLTLGGIVPTGNYTITIQTGTDGNNLLDNCGRGIPAGQSLSVTVFPLTPTPMDSLTKTGCAPDELQLIFKDPMLCNSIAPDGSDFVVTGTSAVTVAGASGDCSVDGFTYLVRVRLSVPVQNAGNFQVMLRTGSDGNTIINECGVETIAGAFKIFSTKDTVSAFFNTSIRYGCIIDTINYTHDGRNGVNSWNWRFDNNINSRAKDTAITWQLEGQKLATLIVTNGTCSDTLIAALSLNSRVKAAFESIANACPGDPVVFKDNSTGPVVSWQWNFGNNNRSLLKTPTAQFYQPSATPRNVLSQLIVKNSIGCADTATNAIYVLSNCYIAIPKGFSPNNDGLNDFLYPTNAYKAKDLLFRIYNRVGQLLFETRNWTNKWDGTFKGNPQDPGTYVWILSYTNIDSGIRVAQKGSTVLIR